MIGIDTNVLVRVLVADDPDQAARAVRLLTRADEAGARLHVPQIVLVETAWVLRTCYGLTREDIARVLGELLGSAPVEVEGADRVERALRAFRAGRADLADYLALEATRAAGAEALATFDETAQGESGFVPPDPDRWPEDLALREDAPRYARRRRRVGAHA